MRDGNRLIGPGGLALWIAATVPAPLLYFGATHRWEENQGVASAVWWCVACVPLLAAVAAARRGPGRPREVAATTLISLALLGGSLAVFRWVIPLQGTVGWRVVLLAGAVAAVVGSLIGYLVGSRGVGRSRSRVGYLAGVMVAVAGAFLAQTTVRLGAEDSTISYDEGRYGGAGPGAVTLPAAGRYAILAVGFSPSRPACSVTGVDRVEPVTVPPSDYGGDAATYAWVAWFRAPGPGVYTLTCRSSDAQASYLVGEMPRIGGAVSSMIHWPLAGILLLGAVPGLLIMLDVAASRRRRKGVLPAGPS
ncbi:hypothetical protein DMB66_22295 [Actinoplanes sp. ATCC 53533]|uniref:hypothetical protein n=1 Tax=Actinoplanes sp. ATCC 53533 TaxID=1288362 RepID=UPI000F7740FC|nr:hypothetical protein [Actinoplanes sp. ATCC 53533]RSM62256.1 hypothetical protein DMB66_22295 [Actinoplanes sp. ATCC 53533]